jgi:hypothetical protein
LSSRCWKSTLFRRQIDRDNPKYFKGKSECRWDALKHLIKVNMPTPNGNNIDFLKVVAKTGDLPKTTKMFTKFWISSLIGATKIVTSAA